MSMTITLWNYSKKHNSTARPDTAGTEVSIVLKQATSFNNPVFILNFGGGLPAYNYVYWSEVGQYYYIDDIVCISNHVFELHCSVDSLATCRPYIFTADAFVKYSTVVYNEYLKDDRIIPTTEIETIVNNNNFTDLHEYNANTSMWILTTFSQTDGLCSYAINLNNLKYLTQKLTVDGSTIWGSIEQLFGDAKGSIIDLKYCPFTQVALQRAHCIADSTTRIYLGTYDTEQDGFVVDSYLYEFTDSVSIGAPDDFTRCAPYTEAKLFIPLIGTVDISLDELQDVSTLGFKYIVNISTGNVSVVLIKNGGVYSSDSKILATFNGNCSLSIPLGFQQINGISALTGVASAAAGIASGGALTIAGIAGAMASMTSAFKKTTSSFNSFSGNFSSNGGTRLKLMLFKHGLSEDPENMATLYGRPCGKVLNMTDLVNGYVECSQFELQAPYDDYIIQDVNNRMNSGVYLY